MSDELMIPPHSVEAEQAVLGAVLTTGNPSQVMDLVTAEDYYRYQNQVVWKAIVALSDRNEAVDPLTVAEHLGQTGELEDAGGRGYLGDLAMSGTSSANTRSYAEIVADKARRRQMMLAANEIMQSAQQAGSAREALDQAQSTIMQIGETTSGSGAVTIRDALDAWMEQMQARAESSNGVTGLATGYADLDRKTTGFHPGDLIIIAGRPSMGKTGFAMGMLGHCGRQRAPAIVFSMEMPKEQITERAVASESHVSLHHIRGAQLNDDEWSRMADATGRLRDWPLLIDDTPALTIGQIRARARRAKQRHGIGVVAVDYLSLAQGEGENRTNQIGDVSRGLKALAKELSLPVVALSQLNRGVESRANKRPNLADLRESGQVEQDADAIIFLYRDKAYNRKSKFGNLAEVNVAKQRNGPTGVVPMVFLEETAEYKDAAPGTQLPTDDGPDYSDNGGFD